MPALLLATGNPAKQDRLRGLLAGLPVTITTPAERGFSLPAVNETGARHLDNAAIKARTFADTAQCAAIASDGGPVIPALEGRWDALRARRSSGPTDEDRITSLLRLLDGVPPELRGAWFIEAVAVAEPGGRLVAAAQRRGEEGRIAWQPDPRPTGGFWLDALWLYPPRWVTVWDLTPAERAHIRTAWDAVAEELRPALRRWAAAGC